MNQQSPAKNSNYFFLIAFSLFLTACDKQSGPVTLDSPVAAKDAISTFEVEPGFKLELVAAEPLIADPVAMEIDENGNMYVVENHGYPLDKTKISTVKMLRDTDGNGVMDKSTVFADTLMMPTGVLRWKKGILVTDAPHVYYMEDTNGDGKADIIEVMLTGFALGNPQHNVNTPVFGLDNWIYLAHERAVGSEVYKAEFGDRGTEIFFPKQPDATRLPENANGRNVRFKPDTHELEMMASTTQYGHTFDVWGNHFLVNNANHLMHSVISAEYLNRNPKLLVTRSTNHIPDHGNAAEIFPITKTPDRQLLTDVGVMTAVCSITAYSGGAFPSDFNSNTTFVAEPVGNLVHVDRLKPDGSTFIASRLRAKKEFLASTDLWSRPVNLYIGPDGALYVVDYYREIIEHPEWLSDDVINSGKLYNGHDMGRIFRVSATDASPATWTKELSLSSATDEELVEKLADRNIWWRRTAQRMLLDRNNPAIVASLIKMTENASAEGRLHALWTLQGMNQLSPEQILKALSDAEAGMRVNAIKLAELHLSNAPELSEKLLAMQDDADAKVRFQLLCTLGFIDSRQAAEVRNKLLFKDIEDEFVQVAALSARSSRTENLLESVLARYQPKVAAFGSLLERLTAMVAADHKSRYAYTLLQNATASVPEDSVTWQVPVLKGLAHGFSNSIALLSSQEQTLLFKAFFEHPSVAVRQASLQVLQSKKLQGGKQIYTAMTKARKIAADENASERDRALAINFLALQNPAPDGPFLKSLALSGESLPIKLAAIRTLNAIPDETITEFTMENWQNLDPTVQDAALNTFMQKESRIKILVDALESGKIQQTSVGWQRSIRLMTQRNIEIRNRARAIFAKDDQRQKMIEEYQPALELKGDIANGKLVYQKSCAICHQVKGKDGIPFGPDLGTIQSWPPSGIMANILDPNQSIAHSFDLWNVALKNGESVQGVITQETPSSITIRNANGQVNTIAREDISSQKAMNMSAMPAGLEEDITHQEMADLIAFLRTGSLVGSNQ
ncbi:MAG: PVC-type heme-binding CxxCH protein [Cyclobacteriaceae bacterium]